MILKTHCVSQFICSLISLHIHHIEIVAHQIKIVELRILVMHELLYEVLF